MKLENYFAAVALVGVVAVCGCKSVAPTASSTPTTAAPAKITVDAAHPAHAIAPTLWGIFFEDINMSTDGGIYPELVRNRSFEYSEKTENWSLVTSGWASGE